jgi:phosphate-selective porin
MTSVLRVVALVSIFVLVRAAAFAQDEEARARTLSPGGPVRVRIDSRPSLEIGNEFRLSLGARFDGDIRAGGPEIGDDDAFEWTGRRLELAGSAGRVRFEISRELGARRPWRDAFADVKSWSWLGVRGGQFKVPFSEERLRSIGKQDFIHRSLAAAFLAPGRDIGLMAHGHAARRAFTYELGVFRGRDEREAIEHDPADAHDARTAAARVTVRPLRWNREKAEDWRSLRLGLAVARGRRGAGITELAGRSVTGRSFFEPVYVQGPVSRFGLEAQWSPGPLRFAGEWMDVRQARLGQALDGSDLSDLLGRGWYVSAVWRVAGGGKSSQPRPTFGVRSLEIGARLEELAFTSAASGAGTGVAHPRADALARQALQVWTFGATWGVHRWFRIQANVLGEEDRGPERLERVEGRQWIGVVRFQFDM